MSSFYLTTTLPYVNAEPHIGFALEIITADVIARYQKLLGNEVFFNTGTDEHGQKIYEKAVAAKQDPQTYVDHFAAKFKNLQPLLNLSPDLHFIRTTDAHHIAAAQEFWQRCAANHNEKNQPDIYKATYSSQYCVGCELEKQASDLIDGCCPLHPDTPLEQREEENYFFRFSRYQDALLELYASNPTFVHPDGKMKEIASFVAGGLQDFSISRLATKMPWGIPVPGDESHVMYVWFDALINYISTLGWPSDEETFKKFWPGIQLAGKDNLRQQAAMWQAMLLSAQLPNSSTILINGFVSVEGQKMSKSLGNVISPVEMVERYGAEATRFLLLRLGPIGEDMDVGWDKFDTVYTAELSNRLGNWCSRVAKMCETTGFSYLDKAAPLYEDFFLRDVQGNRYFTSLNKYAVGDALSDVFNFDLTVLEQWFGEILQEQGADLAQITDLDDYLSQTQPWKQTPEDAHKILLVAVSALLIIARKLEPFMPQTALLIRSHFANKNISSMRPLFPRLT